MTSIPGEHLQAAPMNRAPCGDPANQRSEIRHQVKISPSSEIIVSGAQIGGRALPLLSHIEDIFLHSN